MGCASISTVPLESGIGDFRWVRGGRLRDGDKGDRGPVPSIEVS